MSAEYLVVSSEALFRCRTRTPPMWTLNGCMRLRPGLLALSTREMTERSGVESEVRIRRTWE